MELGRIGIEIELLAPRGRTREDLAEAIANHCGGRVSRFFHPQAEPSKLSRTPLFENLTLGYRVEDAEGKCLAQCVDDLTLQDDLDKRHAPAPDWYRIVSDDARLLRLAQRLMDPEAPLSRVLDPLAELFGTSVEKGEGGMYRVADETDQPVAIGAPLPGERERPCELVTAPIESDHERVLTEWLHLAREMDFSIPKEGATHVHFDASSLCQAGTVANLVRFLFAHGETLKKRLGTNPQCRRLGAWPAELAKIVEVPGFVELEWPEAQAALKQVSLTKYCDFNIRNFIHGVRSKPTFEVRVLPASMDVQAIVAAASCFAAILRWAESGSQALLPIPDHLEEVVTSFPLGMGKGGESTNSASRTG